MKKKVSEMVLHKRQDTTATVIPCLYLLLFPVLRTLAVGLPANKKRTRTLSLRETDSGTSCVAEHSQRHLNLQIACSTAMQSASAFRKESFPQTTRPIMSHPSTKTAPNRAVSISVPRILSPLNMATTLGTIRPM